MSEPTPKRPSVFIEKVMPVKLLNEQVYYKTPPGSVRIKKWLKRTLGDILPELFYLELTDKDGEAVANPSRFRNMGESPEKLAN